MGAAGGSGAGRGQRGRPGAVPRARLGRGRMEFGAVGRMRGLSGGRCWVCLGPGIIYPVPSLVPIPTVFAMNSSILAGVGLTSSTSPAGGCARVSPAGWSCLILTSSSGEEPPSPLYPQQMDSSHAARLCPSTGHPLAAPPPCNGDRSCPCPHRAVVARDTSAPGVSHLPCQQLS